MVFDVTVNMLSVFGIVALAGVVVNDSLILVDFTNRGRNEGMDINSALVNAGKKRFRAILLTTLTTFVGLLPIMFETSVQAQFVIPMALSLIFGIVFASTITLILIPCLYSVVETNHRFVSTIFAALLIFIVCSVSAETIKLPSLGDGSSRLISPELEKQIGQMFLRSLNANLPMNKDPLVQNFVEEHARYLAQYSDLERMLNTILVIDEQSLNAFAAPGGVAGINLGLILNARDINEYSWVIAHELAHLSQRHFARGVEASRASTIPILASMIGAILVGAAGGSDAGLAALSAGQAAAQAKQLRHSRAREIESDRIGLNTMLRANLD